MLSPLVMVGLFFIAMLAGFIDALAGGGGLLTIPALLATGMSPAQALATNKLQACGGSLSASLYFIRRKVVDLNDQKLNILMTFIGSTSGALLVQFVKSDILRLCYEIFWKVVFRDQPEIPGPGKQCNGLYP